MRIDDFEPIAVPRFILDGRREKQRVRTHHVLTRFVQSEVAVLAAATMREIAPDRALGDA